MNVSYDLDTSGGLMPYIHALIKPPTTDEESTSSRSKKSQHPYYRRPGKGHNHDCCDACQEGGDLICCDKCPASFHLGCHDPPLEESDIPMGQWLCLECRSSADKWPPSPTTSHRSFEGSVASGQDRKSRSLRPNRSNSALSSASSSSRKNERDNKEVEMKDPVEPTVVQPQKVAPTQSISEKEPEKEEDLSPMEVLIRAARVMNPTQFQLPREMQVYCPFPGTDRPLDRNGKPLPAALTKDSNGLIPLPAKMCFYCGRSCRVAPLIQCDYCPLVFHQDCLDPPMTALPSGRWMCPNHVEQYIDWQLVNTISATERIALWDKMSGPVDHHAVRLDFLRKCKGMRRPFRVKLASLPSKGRISVPPMVKHHYQKPPSLLPSRRDTVRCRNVIKNYQKYTDSDEEQDKKKTICMNLHCPRYLSKNAICDHSSSDSEDSNDEQTTCANEDLNEMAVEEETNVKRKIDEVLSSSESSKMVAASPRKKKKDDVKKKPSDESMEEESKEAGGKARKKICLPDNVEFAKTLRSIDEQLSSFDGNMIKLLAYQRLQQLMEGSPINIVGDIEDEVAELIKGSIDKSSLAKYGFKHVALPSELLSKNDLERISKEVAGAIAPSEDLVRLRRPPRVLPPIPTVQSVPVGPQSLHSRTPAMLLPQTPTPSLSAHSVKATLCPVERPARNGLGDGLGRPVPMRLSRLQIGLGGGCDLQLQNYGHCNYVSEHHAVIFYDEVTHHFELMNYSEFGSIINGQIYSCDFMDKPANSNTVNAANNQSSSTNAKEDAQPLSAEERAAALREIANKKRGTVNVKDIPKKVQNKVTCPCQCASSPCDDSLVSGWEGGAILHHGSLLQFGCLMFVFSITDVHMVSMSAMES